MHFGLKKCSSKLLTAFAFSILINGFAAAQQLNISADLVNRYIWRGISVNNSPCIQPALSISAAGFAVGFWGSYAVSNMEFNSDEIDGYIGYSADTDGGTFGLLLTDYYYPNAGVRIGDFKNNGGAHTLEIAGSYSGGEFFPVSLLLAYNFHNDPGNNFYYEIGYAYEISGVSLNTFLGGTAGSKDNSGYYRSEKFAVINFGIKGSKTVKITGDFSIPVYSAFILNPKAERAYLVFGMSLFM